MSRPDATIVSATAAISFGNRSDADIRNRIREDVSTFDRVWCPHRAGAAAIYRRLPTARRQEPCVIVATAHPAELDEVVEPLIGRTIPVPPNLERLLSLPRHDVDLAPTLD